MLDPIFWLFVIAAYALLQIPYLPGLASRFAVINCVGIYLISGWRAVVAVGSLSIALWGLLRVVGILREQRGDATAGVAAWLGILSMAGLFLYYKHFIDAPVATQMAGAADNPLLMALLRTVFFSYLFLRAIDLIRAVAWDRAPLLNPMALSGYLAPFHMLSAGPINSYVTHQNIGGGAAPPPPQMSSFLVATQLIVTGLFYKLVIAEAMRFFAFGASGAVVSKSWMDSAWLLIYTFFDFAGYSLVAIGIGVLLGIPTPVNFRSPFLARSVTDFWTRWHISLGAFMRQNIFNPLQLFLLRRFGARHSLLVGAAVLIVTFTLVGMWHRVSISFALWGMFLGGVMVAEKVAIERLACNQKPWHKHATRAWKFLGPLYVFVVIATSFHFVMDEIFRP